MSTVTKKQLIKACTKVAALKIELSRLGLLQSFKAMDEVTRVIGWEVSNKEAERQEALAKLKIEREVESVIAKFKAAKSK
jgi:hypothetical protein